jgi:hypothetical protein
VRRRGVRSAATATCLALCAAPATASQLAPPVPVAYSSAPLVRNATLVRAAGAAIDQALAAAAKRLTAKDAAVSSPLNRVRRLAILAGLEFPLDNYLHVLNHELGHMARASEIGARSSLSFTGVPWEISPFTLRPFATRSTTGVRAGGLEASDVLAHQIEDDWYQRIGGSG